MKGSPSNNFHVTHIGIHIDISFINIFHTVTLLWLAQKIRKEERSFLYVT